MGRPQPQGEATWGQGVKGYGCWPINPARFRVKGHQKPSCECRKNGQQSVRRGRGALTRFGEEPGQKGHGAGLKCHRAGVVVPGRRAGGRRCWSSTVIRSGNSASTSNGNSMAHCAGPDTPPHDVTSAIRSAHPVFISRNGLQGSPRPNSGVQQPRRPHLSGQTAGLLATGLLLSVCVPVEARASKHISLGLDLGEQLRGPTRQDRLHALFPCWSCRQGEFG